MWDGNIIIKHGKISGIIDFSDLYFCDEDSVYYYNSTGNYFIKEVNICEIRRQ